MSKVISGKELSIKLKAEMAEQVKTFPEKYGRVPHLVVILVGEDPASQSYVKGKAKASEHYDTDAGGHFGSGTAETHCGTECG